MWIGGGWGFHNGLIRSCGRETTLLVGGAQPAGLVDGWGRVGGVSYVDGSLVVLGSDWTRGYSEVEFATLKEGAEEWGTRGY